MGVLYFAIDAPAGSVVFTEKNLGGLSVRLSSALLPTIPAFCIMHHVTLLRLAYFLAEEDVLNSSGGMNTAHNVAYAVFQAANFAVLCS